MTFDPSKPYAAKNGRPVRILASDLKSTRPIIAAHMSEDGSSEYIIYHTINGKYGTDGYLSEYNLYNVPGRVVLVRCVRLSEDGCIRFNSTRDRLDNTRFTFEGDKLVAVELIGEPE